MRNIYVNAKEKYNKVSKPFWYEAFLSGLNIVLRGSSQIMSATEGGEGVWKMLTLADKGEGRGVC